MHCRAYSDVDAVAARADLESDHGDPFTLLNVMDEWIRIKTTGSQQRGGGGSDSRKWCRRRGLEEQRLYEIVKLRDQFRSLLADHNLLDASMRKVNDVLQKNSRTTDDHGVLLV